MIRWLNANDVDALPVIAVPRAGSENRVPSIELTPWVYANMDDILSLLHKHGAILFRGFVFGGVGEFEEFATVFCPNLQHYIGGNSPRTRVSGHVYTATDYSKNVRISLHNEASYLRNLPARIVFFCARPAENGGQTLLADSRRVLGRINPAVRDRFVRRRVKYVNNLHDGYGVGRSWTAVFETDIRSEVEERLKRDGYEFSWKENGLRTSIVADATAAHPVTGAEAWINQAEQWHPSSLDLKLRNQLLSIMDPEDLPHNAFFGDGSPFAQSDLDNVRAGMQAEERVLNWAKNDVLVCDNILVMHGRLPYSGDRSILVAFG